MFRVNKFEMLAVNPGRKDSPPKNLWFYKVNKTRNKKYIKGHFDCNFYFYVYYPPKLRPFTQSI